MMSVGDADGLDPTEIAYLRAGYWAAVQTALAMLAVTGRLLAAPVGRVRRTGDAPASEYPLARALFNDLFAMLGPRELANRPPVQRVLRDIRVRLVRHGYLRPRWQRILLPAALVTAPPCLAARLMGHGLPGPVAVLGVTACVGSAAWFLSRRTARGARAAATAGTARAETVELAVALFGNVALRAFLPILARDGGVLDGGTWTRRIDEPEPKRIRWR